MTPNNPIRIKMFCKSLPFWILTLTAFLLSGCDTWIFMRYEVHNKSKNDITIFVPNYISDRQTKPSHIDTILTLKSNEVVMVGGTRAIYPSSRSFYRNYPGVCGIKQILKDTTIPVGCTKKEWKYKKGKSILTLK
jgi:hypothetical protein